MNSKKYKLNSGGAVSINQKIGNHIFVSSAASNSYSILPSTITNSGGNVFINNTIGGNTFDLNTNSSTSVSNNYDTPSPIVGSSGKVDDDFISKNEQEMSSSMIMQDGGINILPIVGVGLCVAMGVGASYIYNKNNRSNQADENYQNRGTELEVYNEVETAGNTLTKYHDLI